MASRRRPVNARAAPRGRRRRCARRPADHAAEHLPSLKRQVQRNADLAVLVGWSLLEGLMRVVPVVMAGVLAEDRPQVPFAVDEHPVGALGSCGAYPPLGIAVRARGPRRGLDHLHALGGGDLVEGGGELGVAVPDEEAEGAGRSPGSMTRLRACCAVHAPSGWAVTPRMCTCRVATSGAAAMSAASTGSAGNKSSADSRASTRSPRDSPPATRSRRSPQRSCIRALQVPPSVLARMWHGRDHAATEWGVVVTWPY